VHATFARIWSRMIDRSQHETVLHDFRFNRDNYARRALENFLSDTPRLLLQVPHNHSDSYFNKIVCQHIIDSIIYFMAECDQRFSNLPLKIFPEDELFDPQSLKSVKLWDFDKFSVSLKGRADLRIEVIPSNESHIFDYKTSSFHKSDKSEYYDQLCLYQILYYPRADKVTKWIYFAFQPYLQSFDSKTELCQNLLEKLKNIIADLYYSGYNLGEKKGKYEDIFLTRRNLKRLQGEL
jgi:hypothetical protein